MDHLIELCETLSMDTSYKYHHCLDEVLFDTIIAKIDSFSKMQCVKKLTELSSKNHKQMSKLANKIIAVRWPKDETQLTIFEFIFDYIHFIKTFQIIEQKYDLNNNNLQSKLAQIESLVMQTLVDFKTGQIQVLYVNLINNNLQFIPELCELYFAEINDCLEENLKTTANMKAYVERMILLRKREMENYNRFLQIVEKMLPIIRKHCATRSRFNDC